MTNTKKKKSKKNFLDKLKDVDYKTLLIENLKKLNNFFRYNVQFISFVILCLISCALLRHYTINKFIDFEATFFDFAVIVLLGSLAYLFKPRKQFWYFFSVMNVITLMNIINTVYYAFFTSFASFGLLASMGQTGEVTDAIFEKLKLVHFIYLLMPIIFVLINRFLTKRDYFGIVEKIEVGKKLFFEVAILGGICLFINISTLSGVDVSRFSKQWNREYVVQRFGIIVYQGNDAFQTLSSKLNSLFGLEEAIERFVTYFEENPYQESKNKYTNKFEGYNVVVMHLESMMTFLIDLKILITSLFKLRKSTKKITHLTSLLILLTISFASLGVLAILFSP